MVRNMTQVSLPPSQDCARAVHHRGIVHNTQILSLRGCIPVQNLTVKDKILTRKNGAVPVRRIDQISLVTRAIYVIAGTIGQDKNEGDTLLCSGQAVFLKDWHARLLGHDPTAPRRALDLVDGEFIRDLGLCAMTIYRIQCDAPQIMRADRLQLGTADMTTTPLRQPVG